MGDLRFCLEQEAAEFDRVLDRGASGVVSGLVLAVDRLGEIGEGEGAHGSAHSGRGGQQRPSAQSKTRSSISA
jgi:hypothetical protein